MAGEEPTAQKACRGYKSVAYLPDSRHRSLPVAALIQTTACLRARLGLEKQAHGIKSMPLLPNLKRNPRGNHKLVLRAGEVGEVGADEKELPAFDG